MGSDIKIRIILDALIILSIAVFPWWLTAFFIAVGIFVMDNFYESFVFAIILDSLYMVPREMFFQIPFVSFLIVAIVFFFVREFKKRLRIY
jgi:hypothetical protein